MAEYRQGAAVLENRRGTARRPSGQAQGQIPTSSRGKVGIGAQVSKDGGEMKNGMFVPVTRIQSSPNVTSDGKARVDTGKPTLTQQGIDMDKFIRENHALIERLRKGTN